MLEIGFIEEMRTIWCNDNVAQIILSNFSYSWKYNLLRLTPFQFETSRQAWFAQIFCWLKNAMFHEESKRILLKTAILIQT